MQQENMNLPYIQEQQPNMMPYMQNMDTRSLTEETRNYRAMFPEIHYRLEPFITSTCDSIEAAGVMPTQQELDCIKTIYNDEFVQCILIWETIWVQKAYGAVPTRLLCGRPGRLVQRKTSAGTSLRLILFKTVSEKTLLPPFWVF